MKRKGPWYVADLEKRNLHGPFGRKKEADKFRTRLRNGSTADWFLEIGTNFVVMGKADLDRGGGSGLQRKEAVR